MNKVKVFHPFLFSLYPSLSLYAFSASQLFFTDIYPSLVVCLSFGTIMLLAWRKLLGDWHRAGYFTSITLFFTFAYAFALFFIAITAGRPNQEHFDLTWGIAYLTLLALASRVGTEKAKLTKLLNIVSMVLVAIPLFNLVYFIWHNPLPPDPLQPSTERNSMNFSTSATQQRSIFYLIFDRYADARTLQNDYGYDNSEFIAELERRNFYVAKKSVANYPKTAHSLASSLNMTYLTDLAQRYPGASQDWRPLLLMLQDFEVWRVLKTYGYRYIHMGSWWGGTHRNPNADENFVDSDFLLSGLNEFERLLLNTSVMNRFIPKKYNNLANESQCRRVQLKLQALRNTATDKQPLFVFSHMLVPHSPYVYDAEGHCMSNQETNARDDREGYIGQVEFVNRELLDLIDYLLGSIKPTPIIIVQSDEGPFPSRYAKDEKGFDWSSASADELQEKLRILNAYFLPDADTKILSQTITPVNTFRIVFREYFGIDLPLLQDRSYVFHDSRHLYQFQDVTEQVQ